MVLGTDDRVFALAMARLADSLGNSFLVIVLPLYIASGEISLAGLEGFSTELLIGVVLSLFGLLNSSLQQFTGRASDRSGRRKAFILAGLVVFGIASALYPLATTYWGVIALRALQGIGAALTIPVTIALVNEYSTDASQRGGNFGVFNTFRLIGFGFGPILAGILITGGFASNTVVTYQVFGTGVSGFDAAFAVAVAGALVSLVLVSVLVDDPEGEVAASDDLSVAVFGSDQLFDPVFVVGVGTFFMATGIAIYATLQEVVNAALGQGPFLFSVQFAAVVIANVLFQVPIGRASDRYGRRPFLVVGFALLAPSVLLQGYVPEFQALFPATIFGVNGPALVMILLRLLQGVSVAMVFAPGLALAGDLARRGQSGTTLSVLTTAFGFGVAIGPLAAGYLVRFGFATPFVFVAVLAALAFVLTYSQVYETAFLHEDRTEAPAD
ncbi:MFS transporter [Halorubellus sp. JP-L1]|uniref:MFS transporter n=1 Tax=Halorubellus sp. JP-L1 TaxID=2715753 RepID=UPI00140C5B48|nr:MFS transporter [Halorubellus sp. JP-L1]NHN43111.1 MFS transporter [Halorubellus sp. JP-L1]